jgi:hypothetical protein
MQLRDYKRNKLHHLTMFYLHKNSLKWNADANQSSAKLQINRNFHFWTCISNRITSCCVQSARVITQSEKNMKKSHPTHKKLWHFNFPIPIHGHKVYTCAQHLRNIARCVIPGNNLWSSRPGLHKSLAQRGHNKSELVPACRFPLVHTLLATPPCAGVEEQSSFSWAHSINNTSTLVIAKRRYLLVNVCSKTRSMRAILNAIHVKTGASCEAVVHALSRR